MGYVFVCRNCEYSVDKDWRGRCPKCKGWYRSHQRITSDDGEVTALTEGQPISLADAIKLVQTNGLDRKIPTNLPGVDWVFYDGLPVKGGGVFLTAESGCGKTTLLMRLFIELTKSKINTMFISAENSIIDLGAQFSRLAQFHNVQTDKLNLLAEKDKDTIIEKLETFNAQVFAVDSLHAVLNVTDESGYDLAVGSTTAVAYLGREIKRISEERQVIIFAIGHHNNDGTIAGGSHLRHMLDGTLVLRHFSKNKKDRRRILRFEGKSRFGPDDREALFEMSKEGDFLDHGPYEVE